MSDQNDHSSEASKSTRLIPGAGQPAVLLLPRPDTPQFRRAFTIVIASIVIGQISGLWQIFAFWNELDSPTERFFIWNDASGIAVYALGLAMMVWDMDQSKLMARRLFNFDVTAIFRAAPDILKYFAGAAVVVLFFAWLLPGGELELAHRPRHLQYSAFFLVVIVAPIVEEIMFRGYLQASMENKFRRTNERLVVNAMFFAAAHVLIFYLFLGVGVPYYIFVLGFLLAKLYDTYRSVMPGIVLHALNNGLVFFLEYLQVSSATT